MHHYSGMSSEAGDPEDREGSWTNETLPLSVRRELLERELKKLGFRRSGEGGASAHAGVSQQQQQPQRRHPHADAESGNHSE
jgi:hypothetical protein